MWLAITNIEDKRARQRTKQAGLPKSNPRKAAGKLIEGLAIQGWQKVLGELALHYPDRFPTTIYYTKNLTSPRRHEGHRGGGKRYIRAR